MVTRPHTSLHLCVSLSLSHKHMLPLAPKPLTQTGLAVTRAGHIGHLAAATTWKSPLTHFITSTFNFSKRRGATRCPRCTLALLFLSVAFFQHGLVLPGSHTVNTAGFLEVLECHSVSHQRHQLSTTKHTHTHTVAQTYLWKALLGENNSNCIKG